MIQGLCNEIFFEIRKRIPNLRKNYSEKLGVSIDQSLIPEEIASQMSERSLRTALFYAEILNQIPELPAAHFGKVLDLGSKDFSYVSSLALFLKKSFEKFDLTGLELDPYPFYFDLFRRRDCAQYYVNTVSTHLGDGAKVEYRQGEWLRWQIPLKNGEKYDLITCFFPFLFEDLYRGVGLPKQGFGPEAFYGKCFESGRRVLFFHQGEEEARESLRLISKYSDFKVTFRQSFQNNPWIIRKNPVEVLLLESQK